MKELDIIKGCKKGDRKAQRALVDTYSNYIFTICMRYMKDRGKAEDCLQESLVQVLSNIEKYDDFGSFKSWMSTLTVRKCIDQLRKEKRHQYSVLDNVAEPGRNEDSNLKLEVEDVMKFVNTIPEQYRIVINMFIVEGYSHKEIAERLGVTESSSRSILTRARRMIQNAFEEKKVKAIQQNHGDAKALKNMKISWS